MSLLPADMTSEEKEHKASSSVTSLSQGKDDTSSIENLVLQAPLKMCLNSPRTTITGRLPPPYVQTNKATSSAQTLAEQIDESTCTVPRQPKPVSTVSHVKASVDIMSLGESLDSTEHATISTPSGEKKSLIIVMSQNKPDDGTGSIKRAVCTSPSHQANQALLNLLTRPTSFSKSKTTSRLSCSHSLSSETDPSAQLTTISKSDGQAVADVSCSANSSSVVIESSASNHSKFHEDDKKAGVSCIVPKIDTKTGKVLPILPQKLVRSDEYNSLTTNMDRKNEGPSIIKKLLHTSYSQLPVVGPTLITSPLSQSTRFNPAVVAHPEQVKETTAQKSSSESQHVFEPATDLENKATFCILPMVSSDKNSVARQDFSTMSQSTVYDKSNYTLKNASSESKLINAKVSLPSAAAVTNKPLSTLFFKIVSLPNAQDMPPTSTASLPQNICNPSDDKVKLTTKTPSGLTAGSSYGVPGQAPSFIVAPSKSLASLPFHHSNQDTSQNLSTGLYSVENQHKNKKILIPISAPSNFSFVDSRSVHMETLTKQAASMKGENPDGKKPVLLFSTKPLAAPAVSKTSSCYELLESVNRRALEQEAQTGDDTFPVRILPPTQTRHFGSQPTRRLDTQLLPLPSIGIPKSVGAKQDVKEKHGTTNNTCDNRTLYSTCVKTVEGSPPVMVITPVLNESQFNVDDVNSTALMQSSNAGGSLDEEFQRVGSDEVKDLAFAQKRDDCFGIKIESVFSLSCNADMKNDMCEEQDLQKKNLDTLGKTFQFNGNSPKSTDPSTDSTVMFPSFNLRTSSDWKNFSKPSFVVLHKLSPKEVTAARLQKTEPRCSNHCRKRHLDNLCHLKLLKCINHPELTEILRVKKPRLMDKNFPNSSPLSMRVTKPIVVNNLGREMCTPSETYMHPNPSGPSISMQSLKDHKYAVDTKNILHLQSRFPTKESKADERESMLIQDQNFPSPNSQAAVDMFGDQLPVDFKEQLLVLKQQVTLKRSQMITRRLSCCRKGKGKNTQFPSLPDKKSKTNEKLIPPCKKISLLKGNIMERLKINKTSLIPTTESVFPGHKVTNVARKSKETVSVNANEAQKPTGVHVPKVSFDKIQAALNSLSKHIATTGKKLNDGSTGYIIMKIDGQHLLVKLPNDTTKLPQASTQTFPLKSHHPLVASAPTQIRNLESKVAKIVNTSTGKLQLDVRSLCLSRNVKSASTCKPASQPISSSSTHSMASFVQIPTAHKPGQHCPVSLSTSTSSHTSEQTNRSVPSLYSPVDRKTLDLVPEGSEFQTKALIKQISCTEVPAMKVSDVSGKIPKVQRSVRSIPAQEKLARRKALEKKYPLPPGVVIKSEPDDSGYELDTNWLVTSEVNTRTEHSERDQVLHTHNHQLSSELCTHTDGEMFGVADDPVSKHMDGDRSSSDSWDEPPPLIQEPSMNRVGSKGADEEGIVDDLPPVLHPMVPSQCLPSSCLSSTSAVDSHLNWGQDGPQPLNLVSMASPFSEGSESSQRNWDSGVEFNTSMASSSVSSLLSEPGQPQIPSSNSTKIQQLKELLKKKEQEIESFRKLRCKLPPLDLDNM